MDIPYIYYDLTDFTNNYLSSIIIHKTHYKMDLFPLMELSLILIIHNLIIVVGSVRCPWLNTIPDPNNSPPYCSCWQCEMSLTGHRYILRDEHPFCIGCYEKQFANTCEECKTVIGSDYKVRNSQWFQIDWQLSIKLFISARKQILTN